MIDVVAVEVIGDHRLRLSFEDGTVGDIAFEDSEWRGVFEPLADPAFFAQVRVDPEGGTIVWPNGVDMRPSRCAPRRGFTASLTDPRAGSVAESRVEAESYYASDSDIAYIRARSPDGPVRSKEQPWGPTGFDEQSGLLVGLEV